MLSKDFEDRGRYKGIRNPVATTWLISFKQISRDSPVVARHLKFICFLAEKQIPISLLPPASDQLEADEAIGILKAYAFITNHEGHDSFDMHRLVRLATRTWLDKGGKHKVCVTEVIRHLNQAIPYPRSYNKHIWIKYLPHLEAALGSRDGYADKSASFLLQIARQCYCVLGQFHKAEQKAWQVLELQEKLFSKKHLETLMTMERIAIDLSQQGKYEEAEAVFRQTVKLKRKVLGEDNPHTLTCMGNLGTVLHDLGKYMEAEKMHRQALDQSVKVLDKDNPDIAFRMSNLAVVLSSRGKHEEAEGLCRQAMEQMRTRLGEEHPDRLSSMGTLGAVLSSQGNYEEAEGLFRRTVKLREKVLGKEHPHTLMSLSNLAAVLKLQGKRENAVALMEKYYQLRVQKLGPDHHMTRSSRRALNVWKLEGQ
ncbi:hypothetical protein IFM61606_02474 [Aspergillus udagawae]|uniref:Kinesin light chain n=1 Tax=Aspergillus udagawae TaxID=91492 RepID=A0ABQ1A5I8_9EURO|nr:hypothetical protein IFM51744_01704 [Aspergillus udagawae]GFF74062.1 hypothetical protein IFM53868_01231 [Aspergillus udagawae]GFG22611.1 hypothetical protein IFM61606_02474 [Aspergillus udagawae]